MARPSSGAVGARCVLLGGLGSDWWARRPDVFVVDLPRDRDAAPISFATVPVHGPRARAVAFHAAVAAAPTAGGDAWAPLVVVYGGGDGAGAAARNAGSVRVLRKALWHASTAHYFPPQFAAVGAALQRPAAAAALPADVWAHALAFCAATWFGDAEPPPPPDDDADADDEEEWQAQPGG